MKLTKTLAALLLGGAVSTAAAQDAPVLPGPPPVVIPPALSAPSLFPAAPSPGLAGLWDPDSSRPTGHLFGEVAVGAYWLHGSGAGPALGSGGTLGVLNDRGAGVSANWQEFNQSSTRTAFGTWSHRP
jgi:hypothetical protein